MSPFVIAVAGGAASGKSEVCLAVMNALLCAKTQKGLSVSWIRLEDFYKPQTDSTNLSRLIATCSNQQSEQFGRVDQINLDPSLPIPAHTVCGALEHGTSMRINNGNGRLNADAKEYCSLPCTMNHPEAFDFALFESCMTRIARGDASVECPRFDFATKQRLSSTTTITSPQVVIISGTLVLHSHVIRELCNLKVFVNVDADVRLANQVIRDTTAIASSNGSLDPRTSMGVPPCSLATVLDAYEFIIKPAFDAFILPTRKFADVIVPRGHHNAVAVSLLTEHVLDLVAVGASSANNVVHAMHNTQNPGVHAGA